MKRFITIVRYIERNYPGCWEASRRNRRIMVRYLIDDATCGLPPILWNA